MADLVYDIGLDEWAWWTTGTFKMMAMLATYTPSYLDAVPNDIVAHECSASGYARATIASPTRTVDNTNHRIVYDCANPTFGSPAAGQTVSGFVLYREVNDDSDSILVAFYDVGDVATDGGALTPTVGVDGLHYLDFDSA